MNATVSKRKIVPDELDAIASTVQEWCDKDGLDFVVTTGGTGFAVRAPSTAGGFALLFVATDTLHGVYSAEA